MRYIDWIAFAYRLKSLNNYLLANANMIFELDAEGNPITANTVLISLLVDFNTLLNADIEKASTQALDKDMYFTLLSNLNALISDSMSESLNIPVELKIIGNTIESKGNLASSKPDFTLKIHADAIDTYIHEVLLMIDTILVMNIYALVSTTYSLILTTLETLEVSGTTVTADTVYKVLTSEFNLDVSATGADVPVSLITSGVGAILSIDSTVDSNYVQLLNSSPDFILQISSTVSLWILRKLSQAYPDLLTSIKDVKLLDYYEIEQGGN